MSKYPDSDLNRSRNTPKSTYHVWHPCSTTASVNDLICPNVKFAPCGNRQIPPSAIEPVRLNVPVPVPVIGRSSMAPAALMPRVMGWDSLTQIMWEPLG